MERHRPITQALMHRFTLSQVSYFVAAGSFGSLSGAARHLNVSQPSISSAIGQIEHVLGYSLFTRHNRFGVRLTPEGRQVFDQARHILALVDDIGAEGELTDSEPSGQVSVGCFDPLIDWPESKEYQLGLFSITGRIPKVVAYAPSLEMLR